jgi:bifunctional non-homologous end joining protein LigD
MAQKKTELKVDGRVLQLSNLEKVMFPASGFTKGQVIDYYIRISPVLLPHLKDRPLTLKRYPDGIDGQHFYEKNAPSHTPSWVKTAPVWRKSGESQIRYILVNDLPTLVWCANLANLEMHVFLAKAPKIEIPTMIVFDLDPGPPAGVLECARVAQWLKKIGDRFNLQCFAKSSGSKGMQIYIPLNTPATYDQTRGFAKTIAEFLEARRPNLVVSEMSKNIRAGKVFIDWSQNTDHKTTVCVYSLRAKREKPYISMAVTWEELDAALEEENSDRFYFEPEEALKRVEEIGDLFAPVLTLKQKIPAGFEKKLEEVKFDAAASRPAKKIQRPQNPARRRTAEKGDTTLKAYNAKRDFTKTQEPPPSKAEPKEGKELLFVIQKHQASHLHYDFRLEMEGVLRSWAVPKGIPTTKGEKRLAMHVEDHPMNYAKFEGTIPPENYGAGTVMVWDIGTYEVADGHPVGSYYKGKIPLILKGKKLKGEWVLVKSGMSKDSGKESWLLLKTGDDAPPISPKKDDESALTGRTMKQIAAENDAQWISNRPASSENRNLKSDRFTGRREERLKSLIETLPKSRPAFVDPMLCKLVQKLPEGDRWLYELKLDGYRALAIRDGKKVELVSRRQKSFNGRFPEIVDALKDFSEKTYVLDGEVVAVTEEGIPSFQLLQNIQGPAKSGKKSGAEARPLLFYAFDILHYDGRDTKKLQLEKRKQLLESLMIESDGTLRYSAVLDAEPNVLIKEVQRRGLEGIVAKLRASYYEPGRRSGAWVKFKTQNAQEFVIGGYKPSSKTSDFQSILVGYYQDQKLMYAAKVKSGFTERVKKNLMSEFRKLKRATCPFQNVPVKKESRWGEGLTEEDMEKCVWVKPEIVCRVQFTEWTAGGNLRHPRFVAVIDDKEPHEVVREG